MRTLVTVAMALATSSAPADDRPASNPMVEALAACLDVRADPDRLACLDASARRLVAAERTRDLVMVTREELVRARRSLFGLSVDETDVLPGQGAAAARMEQLDTTVTAAVATGNDRWTLLLAEGGRWRTTEPWSYGEPRVGMAVAIRRAAMGSFILRSKGQRAVKVLRIN